jgi:hypothetical protein
VEKHKIEFTVAVILIVSEKMHIPTLAPIYYPKMSYIDDSHGPMSIQMVPHKMLSEMEEAASSSNIPTVTRTPSQSQPAYFAPTTEQNYRHSPQPLATLPKTKPSVETTSFC